MKTGEIVTITNSKELSEMGLGELDGRKAIVGDILDSVDRKTKGCWVELWNDSFLGEKEWFIPVESII